MEVHLRAGSAPALLFPDDFKKFKTVADVTSRVQLQAALGDAGEAESDDVVWISADWLRKASGGSADAGKWESGLSAMIAFAAKHGWVREGTPVLVRSHVERAPD